MKFRLLEADEIDCRISICNEYGVGLLLYKNARCDQNILDETVGAMNWQRHHTRDNANCIVSIWDEDKKQWIEKEDTGTESFAEAEKGLASDSFKRACFNWGIGRELYTAPNMFVFSKDLKTHKQDNKGKWCCKDTFRVTVIEHVDDKLVYVRVLNEKTKREIEFGLPAPAKVIDETKVRALEERCKKDRVDVNVILKLYNVKSLSELTEVKHANIHQHWEKIKES